MISALGVIGATSIVWMLAMDAVPPPPGVARLHTARTESEPEAGGTHIRAETVHGPVHVFVPAGFRRRDAGVVVYVHGLYVTVDGAWREHRLAEQFAASGRNAVFIAPEAPRAASDQLAWDDLGALVAVGLRAARLRPPGGPLVVAGHSGAYHTIVPWLAEPALRELVLLDALYGNQDDFRAWLDGGADRRMTLVVKGTGRWADPFVAGFPGAVTVKAIPGGVGELPRAARGAKLLCLRSQYGHFELITEGRVLPVLLRRTGLRPLPAPAPPLPPAPAPPLPPPPSPPAAGPDVPGVPQ